MWQLAVVTYISNEKREKKIARKNNEYKKSVARDQMGRLSLREDSAGGNLRLTSGAITGIVNDRSCTTVRC
jgi:hypothetical protein